MGTVTMTEQVITELLDEIEEVLKFTEMKQPRRKLIGIRMALRSLRDEAGPGSARQGKARDIQCQRVGNHKKSGRIQDASSGNVTGASVFVAVRP